MTKNEEMVTVYIRGMSLSRNSTQNLFSIQYIGLLISGSIPVCCVQRQVVWQIMAGKQLLIILRLDCWQFSALSTFYTLFSKL